MSQVIMAKFAKQVPKHQQKNLTNQQYKKRYSFLANVYYLLSNEKF